MTSNMGAGIIQENFEKLTEKNKDSVLAKTKNEVFDVLKKSIRPEFLNRIDEVIMFEPLSRENVTDIVRIQFENIKKRLQEQDISIEMSDEAMDWLAQLGYDPQFGARPVKRIFQKQILNELSKQILAGTVNKDKTINIELKNNQFIFKN